MESGLILFVFAILGLLLFRIVLPNLKNEGRQFSPRSPKALEYRSKTRREANDESKLEAEKLKHKHKLEKIRLGVATTISGLVLLTALCIILGDTTSSESEKWAFGAVGTIVGYWLKA